MSRLDPADGNAAVSNSATWGARAARAAGKSEVCVIVCRVPKSVVASLEASGHLADHPALFESVLHPDGFDVFSRSASWDPPMYFRLP
jgi:hypothetical protein